jgi:predicted metal-dependent HD superfamily phosphohydrolase
VTSPEVELRRTWQRIAGRRHDDVLDGLLARHREPHRRYHTAVHVMWVCRHVDRLSQEHALADGDAVRVAALFHDAVYDPRSSTNEADSATLADARLADLGWAADRRAAVRRMIEATAGHGDPADLDTAVLLDADLAILGAAPGEYRAYVTGVRAEYGHVPDDAWRTGRARVLESFLERPAIYATDTMRAEREVRARANLGTELSDLRRG